MPGRLLPFRVLRPSTEGWRNYLATFEVRCATCEAITFTTLLVRQPPEWIRCAACGAPALEERVRQIPTPAELVAEANLPENR